jgi:hypothetical protein
MFQALIALTLSVVTTSPSLASDTTGVMSPVHQFVDSFNKGDATTATECEFGLAVHTASISSILRWCLPPSNGVSSHTSRMGSISAAGTSRSPIESTFESLCSLA